MNGRLWQTILGLSHRPVQVTCPGHISPSSPPKAPIHHFFIQNRFLLLPEAPCSGIKYGSLPTVQVTIMSRVCQVTGKRPTTGNNVSHSNTKTKRRFLPNLHTHRFWVESEKRWVKLRVSTKGLRTIDKNGIDAVLADLRARGEKI